MEDEIKKLKEENKRLKKELNRMYDLVITYEFKQMVSIMNPIKWR